MGWPGEKACHDTQRMELHGYVYGLWEVNSGHASKESREDTFWTQAGLHARLRRAPTAGGPECALAVSLLMKSLNNYIRRHPYAAGRSKVWEEPGA